MGCCVSSPHSKRKYRDPADLEEEIVPLRYFGTFRNGSVAIPDDIPGLPSTHHHAHLASDPGVLLYEGEIDQGHAFRFIRYLELLLLLPVFFYVTIPALISAIYKTAFGHGLSCDQSCCWLRKEYSTRTFFRVYYNRIEVNNPTMRFPWGCLGCGSWNADHVLTHPFDRGAFGFRKIHCGLLNYCFCIWPCFGGSVARQRCPCNGPVWNRMFTGCNGWWCDEWLCDLCCCSYHYHGMADPDEVAFVASICLQSYFEGRALTRENVDECILFWKENISEAGSGIHRDVCCEPYLKLPFYTGLYCYKKLWHCRRNIPYKKDDITDEVKEVYDDYKKKCDEQTDFYSAYHGPVRSSTLCKKLGCRRFFGRKGCIFCTEGCDHFSGKAGDPAPPFYHRDIDDENDASVVLRKVLGPPPRNVVYNRWEFDEESGVSMLVTRGGDVTEGTERKGLDVEKYEAEELDSFVERGRESLPASNKVAEGLF